VSGYFKLLSYTLGQKLACMSWNCNHNCEKHLTAS